jgi:uncharacterized protein VirK/YbjX
VSYTFQAQTGCADKIFYCTYILLESNIVKDSEQIKRKKRREYKRRYRTNPEYKRNKLIRWEYKRKKLTSQ